ncbi:MAG: hypothetical protein ABH873_09500 [Candidatus Firestonebacteria bacterium]
MKKLIILLILGLLIYFAYQKYIKGPIFKSTTSVKEIQNPLILDIELGKFVMIKSKSVPKGEIKLSKINDSNSIVLQIYKSFGTVTKSRDLRKVISNIAVVEVKLIEVNNNKARVSLRITSGPKEQLETSE